MIKPEGTADQSRQPHSESSETETETRESRDPLESLPKSKETSLRNAARRAATSIYSVIDSFLSEPRLDQKDNIVEYWYGHRVSHPILYALSKVVLAVPAT